MNMNSVPLESVVICKNESTANNNASPHHRSNNNNNAKNDNDGKATNVKVCVRLRPLLESDFNKNNNNADNNNNTNTPRKSGGMKRHTSGLATPSTTTIGGNRNKSSSIKKSVSTSNKNNHAEQQQQSNNNNDIQDIPPSCCWTTYPTNLQRITQSIHTLDNMERKRHEAADYTFDRVYAPNESTNVLYSESIKSVVNSVVDGFHGSVFAYGQVRVYDMICMLLLYSFDLDDSSVYN